MNADMFTAFKDVPTIVFCTIVGTAGVCWLLYEILHKETGETNLETTKHGTGFATESNMENNPYSVVMLQIFCRHEDADSILDSLEDIASNSGLCCLELAHYEAEDEQKELAEQILEKEL